jgi:ribosomal protein S18 acetylase RimI-like enzyme
MIRPGTPEDADGAARVHVETWQAAYAHALPADLLAALSVDQRASGWRRWPPTFVAEEAGVIVGFIAVGATRDGDADAELFSLYVHPDSWGTGIGRALIEAGEHRLRERGHTTAILWVLEDNPRARRFYELAGWTADGTEREIELFGFHLPEVRYAKRL